MILNEENRCTTLRFVIFFFSKRLLWALFQVTLRARMALPDLQWNSWNYNIIINVEDTFVFFWLKQCLLLWVSSLLPINKKFASGEIANENKELKETKTLIYNSYLIRQSFQGYRCKSGIVRFSDVHCATLGKQLKFIWSA